ncbi:recombinase family protein [Candidatus Amarobacter glycogenicus]|uniref:recombinase family protein n=1 Tax=Candidatus Amarobacter glycogenicus TaxID=3140699 RepID=UPI003134F774|nr:recombinase family protein [Dehalococcoidia bacterium]
MKFYNVTEPFDDSPAGLIGEGMLQLIAEWYSKDLQHKVTAGLRKRAEKGLMNGMPPFGYRQSDSPASEPPLIIPEEACHVREAFERFATGTASYREIASDWNKRGLRTRHRPQSGRPEDGPRLWTGDSVRKLLQNPV